MKCWRMKKLTSFRSSKYHDEFCVWLWQELLRSLHLLSLVQRECWYEVGTWHWIKVWIMSPHGTRVSFYLMILTMQYQLSARRENLYFPSYSIVFAANIPVLLKIKKRRVKKNSHYAESFCSFSPVLPLCIYTVF